MRNKRVIVECFFGRMKRKYAMFSRKWTLDDQSFDLFFDVACAFVNADIIRNPLTSDEQHAHLNIIIYWRLREEERLRRRAEINARYRARLDTNYRSMSLSILETPPVLPDLNL